MNDEQIIKQIVKTQSNQQMKLVNDNKTILRITGLIEDKTSDEMKIIYSKLDSDIAGALMSINAVKGVNIGAGMNSAFLSGEENSDEIRSAGNKANFQSNNAAGILGGVIIVERLSYNILIID